MGFKDLDSLDKFLTIFLKIIDNEIKTSQEPSIRKIFIEEKDTIHTIVRLIRQLERMSEEEIQQSLEEMSQDKDLASFMAIAFKTQDIDTLLTE